MRAVQATTSEASGVPRIADLPDLVAGPGEAVVEVSFIDTLFVETQVHPTPSESAADAPCVPSGGIAGTVASVGTGVDRSWVGRHIVAILGWSGGYAEQTVVSARNLIAVPDDVRMPEAAAMVHDATTAIALHDAVSPKPGEVVLTLGATGGMGVLLVELARESGARVLAGARGPATLDPVWRLGAEPVDLSRPDWPDTIAHATDGAGVDVVLDGVGGELGLAAFAATADGGRFSAHGGPNGSFATIDPKQARRRGITLRSITELQYCRTSWPTCSPES